MNDHIVLQVPARQPNWPKRIAMVVAGALAAIAAFWLANFVSELIWPTIPSPAVSAPTETAIGTATAMVRARYPFSDLRNVRTGRDGVHVCGEFNPGAQVARDEWKGFVVDPATRQLRVAGDASFPPLAATAC